MRHAFEACEDGDCERNDTDRNARDDSEEPKLAQLSDLIRVLHGRFAKMARLFGDPRHVPVRRKSAGVSRIDRENEIGSANGHANPHEFALIHLEIRDVDRLSREAGAVPRELHAHRF